MLFSEICSELVLIVLMLVLIPAEFSMILIMFDTIIEEFAEMVADN